MYLPCEPARTFCRAAFLLSLLVAFLTLSSHCRCKSSRHSRTTTVDADSYHLVVRGFTVKLQWRTTQFINWQAFELSKLFDLWAPAPDRSMQKILSTFSSNNKLLLHKTSKWLYNNTEVRFILSSTSLLCFLGALKRLIKNSLLSCTNCINLSAIKGWNKQTEEQQKCRNYSNSPFRSCATSAQRPRRSLMYPTCLHMSRPSLIYQTALSYRFGLKQSLMPKHSLKHSTVGILLTALVTSFRNVWLSRSKGWRLNGKGVSLL